MRRFLTGSLIVAGFMLLAVKLGENYLIFAYGGSAEKMQAQHCSVTKPSDAAEQDIKDRAEMWPHVEKGRDAEMKNSGRRTRGAGVEGRWR